MRALLDGDIICYSAGFSSDKRTYSINDQSFRYKKDAIKYCVENGFDPKNIVKEIIPEPLEYCLGNVKKMINSILSAVETDDYQIYLTGEGNFREEVATRHVYKGNRDPTHKPYHYDAIREYLIDYWDASIINGMEADDALGIRQYEDYVSTLEDQAMGHPVGTSTVICTIDKDLDQIPGWHYNWKKDEKYWIEEKEALINFYTQLLTGDPTDNIKGPYGVGPQTAKKILKNCNTEKEMYDRVLRQYEESFPEEDVEALIQENGQLLWIFRKPNDLWRLPNGR